MVAASAMGRAVAVKRLVASGAAARRALLREARLIARAGGHRHVVTALGIWEEHDAGPRLVVELCVGTLAERMRQERAGRCAEPSAIAAWCLQLADGLAHLHGVGIVHRDLKPANVLLRAAPAGEGEGEVVITDFGISKELRSSPHHTAPSTQASRLGTFQCGPRRHPSPAVRRSP